jgi:hypothetical protein
MSIRRERLQEIVAAASLAIARMAVRIACCWFAAKDVSYACSVTPGFKARLQFPIVD